MALGLSSPASLGRAADREYKDGNTFLEFRLDYLTDPSAGADVIRSFRKRYPDSHILATCRRTQNKGHFSGTISQQIAHLENAVKAGAAAVDLEIESAERVAKAIPLLRAAGPLLISYHNFESTPPLDGILRRLQRIPADAYKIATTPRKPSDNQRILAFARQYSGDCQLVLFGMSELAVATRVLTPGLGCVFTYAAPSGIPGTAAGQIAAHDLRSLYHCEKLNRQTRVYGVIADPVAHSKSPVLHNRAFQARRVDAVYLPFLIAPAHLRDWMKLAGSLPVSGFSVTLPHKQRIIRYLDIVDPVAKRIGAVNTVWRKAGKWRGANTDTEGVLKPLKRHLRLAHASVLIAGYGGGARAAAFALHDAGAKVTITGRDMKRAQSLATAVNAEVATLKESQNCRYDVLVHATPVGMSPKPNECLFGGAIPADVVLDMVYNPRQTVLLDRAKQQGCTLVYGSEMLLEQAACQFEIWTGESAPRSVMHNALAHTA